MKLSRACLISALTPMAIGAAVLASSVSVYATTAQPRPAAGHARLAAAVKPATGAGSVPVVVTCANKEKVKPGSFILTCADANSVLIHLNWQTWSGSSGYAAGTWDVNDCVPNCALGKFDKFPALVVVYRPEPLPGHADVRHFTRLTTILPGPHCFTAGGKRTCYPTVSTTGLWSHL